jgi:hypothetical protein
VTALHRRARRDSSMLLAAVLSLRSFTPARAHSRDMFAAAADPRASRCVTGRCAGVTPAPLFGRLSFFLAPLFGRLVAAGVTACFLAARLSYDATTPSARSKPVQRRAAPAAGCVPRCQPACWALRAPRPRERPRVLCLAPAAPRRGPCSARRCARRRVLCRPRWPRKRLRPRWRLPHPSPSVPQSCAARRAPPYSLSRPACAC